MRVRERLLVSFGLKPNEGWPVLLLMLLSFCQGWALVLADTAALTLLLDRLGAGALANTYLVAAAVVPLVGLLISWVGQKIATARLAAVIFFVLTIAIVVLWFFADQATWAIYLLPIWFRIFNAQSSVLFWGLAGQLLNIRQAKRLYGIIGTGENISRVAGYGVVPLLTPLIGVANLLVIVAIALVGGLISILLFERVIGHNQRTERPPYQLNPTQAAKQPHGLRAMFTNPYALRIMVLIAIGNWSFSLLELTFADQVEQSFRDPAMLANFLAGFSMIISIIRLLGRPLLAGPLVARYGVGVGLLIQPVLLTIGVLVLLAGNALNSLVSLFWLVVVIRTMDNACNMVLTRPVLQILYQPLPSNQRLAAQSLSDGVVAPLALGAVGLIGIVIGTSATNTILGLMLVLSLIWVGLAYQVGHSYVQALSQSLLRRFGFDPNADLHDPDALAHVQRALSSPYTGDVLYAIDLLSKRMPHVLQPAQETLLQHRDAGVRRSMLMLISQGVISAEPEHLIQFLQQEGDPRTRAAAIQAICAIAKEEAIDLASQFMHDPDPIISQSALVGLLRHGGIAGILAGGQHLLERSRSADPNQRILAAQVAGELQSIDLFHPLRPLFYDADPAVRRAVLDAAGHTKSLRLLPLQIAALADQSTASIAANSIVQIGEPAIPFLAQAFERTSGSEQHHLATILGRIGGPPAITILQQHLRHQSAALRGAVTSSLVACGYLAPRDQQPLLRQQIRSEAEQAATLIAITAEFEPTDLLSDALISDIERCQQRILDLLALMGDSRILAIAREHLIQSSSTRRAAAIEILDVLLPTDLRGVVLPLFEASSPATQLPRLRAAFAIPQQSSISWLLTLNEQTQLPLSEWSRTCARASAAARQIIPATAETNAACAMVERVIALRRVNLFAQTPGEILAEIADRLDRIELPSNATIFHEGDAGTTMYLLTIGRVRIQTNGQTIITLAAGDGFGEMAVLDPAPRSATAETLEPTELLQLQRADLDALFAERPEIVRSLIRTLTRNLRQTVSDLATLRAQPSHS